MSYFSYEANIEFGLASFNFIRLLKGNERRTSGHKYMQARVR